jgi:hypothetical protein
VWLRAFFIATNMLTTYRLPEDFPQLDSAIKELLHDSSGWKNRGAVLGLCAGFSAPVAGALVTIISWFSDPVWHGLALHQAGTTLFIMALPLLIFGAHCLDLLDKERRTVQDLEGEKERS